MRFRVRYSQRPQGRIGDPGKGGDVQTHRDAVPRQHFLGDHLDRRFAQIDGVDPDRTACGPEGVPARFEAFTQFAVDEQQPGLAGGDGRAHDCRAGNGRPAVSLAHVDPVGRGKRDRFDPHIVHGGPEGARAAVRHDRVGRTVDLDQRQRVRLRTHHHQMAFGQVRVIADEQVGALAVHDQAVGVEDLDTQTRERVEPAVPSGTDQVDDIAVALDEAALVFDQRGRGVKHG